MGTPHQGGNGVSWAQYLAYIASIYYHTSDHILKHLEEHSEWLEDQIEHFKSISSDFETKFCYETYPTRLKAGQSLLV